MSTEEMKQENIEQDQSLELSNEDLGKEVTIEQEEYRTLSDPQLFMDQFFKEANIGIDARQQLVTERFRRAVFDEALVVYSKRAAIYNAGQNQKPKHLRNPVSKLDKRVFEANFNFYIEQRGLELEMDWKDGLTFETEDDGEIDKMIRCLRVDPVNKDIIRHWMWLVKRSMYHPCLDKHAVIMLMLVSKEQGVGKSTFIRKFLDVLKPFCFSTTIDQVADSRFQVGMSQCYAVILDELAKLERTDINIIKRLITMSDNSLRPLHANHVENRTNRSSFIGASNRKIVEAIYDPTGMRRYIEIELEQSIDWGLFGQIDFLKAWRSIDENRERGYIDSVMNYVKDQQESYRDTDVVDDFVTYYDLKRGSELAEISSTTLYSTYKSWCNQMQYSYLDHRPFGKKLIANNLARIKRKSGNVYLINSASPIFDSMDAQLQISALQAS